MNIDKQDFRDAMACLGAAVNIITTDGPAGQAGFTASAGAASPIRRRRCWCASIAALRCGRFLTTTAPCALTP